MSLFMYDTPIGSVAIRESEGKLTNLYFNASTDMFYSEEIEETDILKEAYRQLMLYFGGKLNVFTVPIHYNGTPFQNKVWRELCNIPYGTTCSYKEIACKISNPNASRAVGMANNKNPLPIFVPCHRVIGTSGKLVGYAGGINVKTFLLETERNR